MFSRDGVVGAVTLPQARARIAMWLPIAGREIVGIAFAADPPGGMLDLLALVGWDGACLRILGLEVLAFTGVDGASLSSRFAGIGDGTRISIARTAGVPRHGLPKRWETWIDLLAWRDLAPLADAPVRPPLPGTRQADMAVIRARVISRAQPALPGGSRRRRWRRSRRPRSARRRRLRRRAGTACGTFPEPCPLKPRNARFATAARKPDAAGRMASL